jgi:hypothetical protein
MPFVSTRKKVLLFLCEMQKTIIPIIIFSIYRIADYEYFIFNDLNQDKKNG